MRILYLTQWFEPEPNIIKGVAFVRSLERAGHEVTIVTGFPNYPIGKLYPGYRLRLIQEETMGGVRVIRLPLYPSHDTSTLRRSLNFLSFFSSALVYCLARAGRFDMIYAYHPPITVGLAAAIAGWVRRIPLLLDVQDLWPDTIAASGMKGASRVSRAVDLLCRFTYHRAAMVVAQSAGMARILTRRGVHPERVTTIRNWANLAFRPDLRGSANPRFTLVYGGNLGRAQGLETIVDAAAIVARARSDIEIRLIGDGTDADLLKERAKNVSSLRIEGAVPLSTIEEIFARADALILHLRNEPLFRITIPSKVQAYLAVGRPIVAGITGEAAELLDASQAALVAPPDDPQALAEAICRVVDMSADERDRMGQAGRRFYLEQFSFERGVERTLDAIEAVGASRRSLSRAATA